MRHLTFMKSSHSQGSQTCKCIHIVQTLECASCSTDRQKTDRRVIAWQVSSWRGELIHPNLWRHSTTSQQLSDNFLHIWSFCSIEIWSAWDTFWLIIKWDLFCHLWLKFLPDQESCRRSAVFLVPAFSHSSLCRSGSCNSLATGNQQSVGFFRLPSPATLLFITCGVDGWLHTPFCREPS